MKKETKTLIITWIAVLTLILCAVGATYAYFTAQMGEGVGTDINANTGTTDSLKFTAGKAINIIANQENFGKDKGNLSDATTGQVELIANNTTNDATYNYQVYLEIAKNELTYTTENNTAELLLKVTAPDGTELTNISGLNYVTVGDVSGFDITTAKELITIAKDKEIHATTSKVTEEWNVSIILVNLETNQSDNMGKSFNAKLLMQEEALRVTLADKCAGQNMAQCLKDNAALEPTLLHHDANLENGAGDDSYRYAGANPNNYVCFGSDAETCPTENLYRIIGVFDKQIKLIKYEYALETLLGTDGDYARNNPVGQDYKGELSEMPSYYWNAGTNEGGTGSNLWRESRLNTINLNTNFINNIGEDWANKIAVTTWNIGGMAMENGYRSSAKRIFDYEVGSNKIDDAYEAKIGLMYLSEYAYAASAENWTKSINDYIKSDIKEDDWIYIIERLDNITSNRLIRKCL